MKWRDLKVYDVEASGRATEYKIFLFRTELKALYEELRLGWRCSEQKWTNQIKCTRLIWMPTGILPVRRIWQRKKSGLLVSAKH